MKGWKRSGKTIENEKEILKFEMDNPGVKVLRLSKEDMNKKLKAWIPWLE